MRVLGPNSRMPAVAALDSLLCLEFHWQAKAVVLVAMAFAG